MDGVAIAGSVEPANQVPYQREFFQHCCTFAHELLVDFHPHAPRLRSEDAYNLAPDIELDTDSINRNRVGMRYYRGLIGYYYDKIVRFAALPRDADNRSQFYEDWRVELPKMQDLDRYVCGECRDEVGGSRLRDFIHYCNVAEWDVELEEVETLSVGASMQYKARLPKIDRRDPDNLRPHPANNVREWVTNTNNVERGWRLMMRDFDAAVKRYDRDPAVRMLSGIHT